MAWFWMLKKEVQSLVRDKTAVFTLLLVPLILIGILGAALSNAFGANEASEITIEPLRLQIENYDEGILGETLISEVFSDPQIVRIFRLVGKDEAEVIMTIPKDFSHQSWGLGSEKITVQIQTDRPERIGVSILKSVMESFLKQVKVQYVLMEQMALGEMAPSADVNANGEGEAPVQSPALPEVYEQSISGNEAPIVSSFAYYAVGMGVMYMLFLGVAATKALMVEVQEHTLQRLLITPQSLPALLLGKFTGWTVLGVLQFSVLIIGTALIYDVYWGDSYLQLYVIVIAFAFSVIGISYLLATLFSKVQSADQFGNIAVMIMAALGGSMAPIYSLPEVLNQAAKAIPNGRALQIFLDIMFGATWTEVFQAAAVLVLMGAACIAIGTYRMQRQWKG